MFILDVDAIGSDWVAVMFMKRTTYLSYDRKCPDARQREVNGPLWEGRRSAFVASATAG